MMQKQITTKDVAGAVILYNSPAEVIDNIQTYVAQVSRLYIVDNSVEPNVKLISKLQALPNAVYHSLGENKGIAIALNWAARQAIANGFSVLLTMDDDTRTPLTMVNDMLSFWNQYTQPIGILSGVHHTKRDLVQFRTLYYTLTSGNLLNLEAYKAIGGFQDELFIDHVDHEYGLRLNTNGYQVVELPSIRLEHKLGYSQQLKVGPYVIKRYGTHSPIRQYYFARNGIYLARLYLKDQPQFAWMVIKELLKRWLKAVLLDADRKGRTNMLIAGLQDGWKGKLGQYSPR